MALSVHVLILYIKFPIIDNSSEKQISFLTLGKPNRFVSLDKFMSQGLLEVI